MSEFEELKESFLQAKYGSFLVLPLKYDDGGLDLGWLESSCEHISVDTMDLTENVKAMMNVNDSANVGTVYRIPAEVVSAAILGDLPVDSELYATDDADYRFDLFDSYLYIFHTQVAFFCLGITYESMYALQHIRMPGYSVNSTGYFALTPEGEKMTLDMAGQLEAMYARCGLRSFYVTKNSCFLEAYTFTVAVVPQRFTKLETIRQATYNLHALEPLDKLIEDESEQDMRFVYAKKDQELLSYRWGCCVTSQDISYIFADETMDMNAELEEQAADGLPIIALGLYEKYTCLRFAELLTKVDKKQQDRIKRLKTLMLEFQAYGTVAPANISRWHNVKGIYKNLLEVCEIPDAIEDIDRKINILSEHQKELNESRNNAIAGIITVFGAVSIIASVLSVTQILSNGATIEWIATGVTSVLMAVISFMILLKTK